MEIKDNWKIEYGGMLNGMFRRNIFKDVKDRDSLNKLKDEFGYKDFYNSIYVYDNSDNIEESNIYGPLVIDLDSSIKSEEDFERLKEDLSLVVSSLSVLMGLNENNFVLHFSGNKGFHISIPPSVFAIKPSKDLHTYYRKIAEKIRDKSSISTIDMKIYDKRRLIRVENTINNKTGLYKVPVSYDQVRSFSLKDMVMYAKETKNATYNKDLYLVPEARQFLNNIIDEVKNSKNKIKNKKIVINNKRKIPNTPCLRDLIKNGVNKGQRNNTAVALASIFLQNGFSYEESLQMLLYWNSNNGIGLPEREITSTVKSALKMIERGKVFGCSTLSQLGECNSKCKFYENND